MTTREVSGVCFFLGLACICALCICLFAQKVDECSSCEEVESDNQVIYHDPFGKEINNEQPVVGSLDGRADKSWRPIPQRIRPGAPGEQVRPVRQNCVQCK